MPWELIGYSFLRFSVLKLGIIIGYVFPVWSLGHARELYELKKVVCKSLDKPRGVLPIMGYTGRLRPKGVFFSGFRYIKG